MHQLIARCPPLDRNSLYCNLLQCTHFAATSAIARGPAAPLGFVSGYRAPHAAATLFVWQVAVAPEARGLGLARQLVRAILARPCNADLMHLETTITPDNAASWSLFTALARDLAAPLAKRLVFDRERHFDGAHDSEVLVRIGPFGALGADAVDHPKPRRSA